MSLTVWDIETTIKSQFKRKSTPFGGLNHVVVHGFKRKDEQAPHVHFFGRAKPGPGWLRPVLEGTKLLAGFNIKFDLLHALQDEDNLRAWMKYTSDGGLIWDCQLAEYLLEGMGQPSHMLSLDEVAPRYGGEVKIDEVKALWNAGVDTTDIEPDLLVRYLAGDADGRPGDLQNTERVALGQIARARAAGQLNSILLNMGSLVCTIEMERNGMHIDVPLAMQLAAALRLEIGKVQAELEKYLPEGLPFEFKWTSRFHKSALIFGGKVRYDRREWLLAKEYGFQAAGEYTFDPPPTDRIDEHYAYASKEETHYVLEDGRTVECLWYEHAWPAEGREDTRVQFKSGKNAGEFKTKKVKVPDLTKPKSRMGTDWFTFPGFTMPKQEWASDTPGVYSTASDVIAELGNRNIPFLKALAALQSMTKDLGTYYIVTDEETGESKGMLSLVGADGLVHHKLNHTSTVTGRFSSSDPNLQNVPKGSKSDVKRVFVSRFDDGVIIQSDFTALEVYVQAIITGCRQLIEDLKAGLDMHCVRVSQKEGLPYDEVLKLCKGYTDEAGVWHDAVPEWDQRRTKAKVFSFQRAYGAGAAKIAESTGMPQEEVEALIAAESERYPEIDEFYDGLTKAIQRSRRPSGGAIPHPIVRGVMCNLGTGHYRTPDGKLYEYREQPAPEYLVKRGTYQSFSPTEIKNYVVQGEGGEWAKAAMWLAVRAFYREGNFNGRGLLVNQVHDAVYADAAPEVKEKVAALLHACMEAASDFMEYQFKWPVAVPVPSDTTWGTSMMDEERIPGVQDSAKPLREQLRAEYMGGYVPSFAN